MAKNKETWIIYKTEENSSTIGWENRTLPDGGLTDILAEEHDYRPQLKYPRVGDRLAIFENPHVEGEAKHLDPTHVREGDWVVSKVEIFGANLPTYLIQEIVVCYCTHEPITPEWKELPAAKYPQKVRDKYPDLPDSSFYDDAKLVEKA